MTCQIDGCINFADLDHALCFFHRTRLPVELQQDMTRAAKAYHNNPMSAAKFRAHNRLLTEARAIIAGLETGAVRTA